MLAYELFLKNEHYKGEFVKKQKLVKKVFMSRRSCVVDRKSIEEYGSEKMDEYSTFQELLSLPSNTASNLGLPNRVTGPNSPRPYVEIFGRFENKKVGPVISLSVKGKLEKRTIEFKAEKVMSKGKESISAKGSLLLNLDKESYFIKNKNLFEEYVKSGILTKDAKFQSSTFKKMCLAFFKYSQSHWKDEVKNRKIDFSIFVLPSDGDVEFRSAEQENDSSASSFTDSFGNRVTDYAEDATQTAKFLSYDDRAFSINCTKGKNFYRNLSIGKESHRRVNVPPDSVFSISGLQWVFINTENSKSIFERTSRGIYHQLWKNYNDLGPNKSIQTRSQLKVICYKSSQAKMEILIDENLTMEDMKDIFSKIRDEKEIPAGALELLIDTSGKNTVWTDYLYCIRSMLAKKSIGKAFLAAKFTLMLRKKLFDWLGQKLSDEADLFFKRSDFCIKVLGIHDRDQELMDNNEQYAFKIGRMAGQYIKFKQAVDESNNSLRDMLTFSRYDREKLRFVLQRIGLGINLSKASQNKIDEISKFVKENYPASEIDDSNAANDYSYFFYKGYFSKEN